MGGTAGVFSKSGRDAPRLVAKMLTAMQYRARDGVAVAWNGNFESAASPAALLPSSSAAHVALGYALTRTMPDDTLQPIRTEKGWCCVDGRVVANRALVGGHQAIGELGRKLCDRRFWQIPQDTEGAYSVCFCTDDTMLVCRDVLGLKPVFVGRKNDLVAVASDRKALWALGMDETITFPPGGYLQADSSGIVLRGLGGPHPPARAQLRGKPDVAALLHSLIESVCIQTANAGRVAVGFSGGVDSAVIAKIAKGADVDALLVTVGIGRTSEMVQAESAAREIGLPIVAKPFSEGELEKYVDRVLWLIEEPSLMKLSIAIGIHLTAEIAAEKGCSLLLLGQGSDELFGGYKRFATILGERGTRGASSAILQSIRTAHEVNYQRDDQAVASLGVELRLPFATTQLTQMAVSMPLRMKIRSPSDNMRKWILRQAAIKLGVPSSIAMRPKKAIQHTTGIEKAIRRTARSQGADPSAYLERRLDKMRESFDSSPNSK